MPGHACSRKRQYLAADEKDRLICGETVRLKKVRFEDQSTVEPGHELPCWRADEADGG
jgi:hypothetical protein